MKRYKKYTSFLLKVGFPSSYLVVFPPTAIALGSSAIAELFSEGRSGPWAALVGSAEGSTKGFAKVPLRFSKFWGVSGFLGRSFLVGCQKGFEGRFPPRFHWGCFTKVPHLSLKWLLFQKRFFLQGSANCSFTIGNSQSRSGVKVAWVVDMSHPYTSYPIRKRPIMSLLLGYSLGLFLYFPGDSLFQKKHIALNNRVLTLEFRGQGSTQQAGESSIGIHVGNFPQANAIPRNSRP